MLPSTPPLPPPSQIMAGRHGKTGEIDADAKIIYSHDLRKSIARVLTVINAKQRSQLRLFYKNKKYTPLDLRPKQTRAIRRRLSPEDKARVLEKTKKRNMHFPQRKFAVKVHNSSSFSQFISTPPLSRCTVANKRFPGCLNIPSAVLGVTDGTNWVKRGISGTTWRRGVLFSLEAKTKEHMKLASHGSMGNLGLTCNYSPGLDPSCWLGRVCPNGTSRGPARLGSPLQQ